MRRTILVVFMLGVALWVGASAGASVIYDNGGPQLAGGFYSDPNAFVLVANGFSLDPGSNTITDVHWWGFYFPGSTAGPDDFTIQIFADDSGHPETTPSVLSVNVGAVTAVDSGLTDSSGRTVYEYSADISPLTLSANTTYWLDIFNTTSSSDLSFWVWSLSDSSGSSDVYINLANTGFVPSTYGQMAFTLTNDAVVPEPPSVVLLGLGLSGMMVWRSRRSVQHG